MSAIAVRLLRRARLRVALSSALCGLPLLLAAMALAWRLTGANGGWVALLVGGLAVAALATWQRRRLDSQWLVRRLDTHAGMQDSADLLLRPSSGLNALQQLQQQRVHDWLQAHVPDLRPVWPWRRLLACWLLGLAIGVAAIAWPATTPDAATAPAAVADDDADAPPRLQSARLHITPPAFTGQRPVEQDALDARAPHGSRLGWSLQLQPQPREAALQLHDGRRIALQRDGEGWAATWTLDRSVLYRVVTVPAAADNRLYRLDAVIDQLPQVRVLLPEQTRVTARPGQRQWPLRFLATDDYGVAADARLRLTVAEGSGENITFRESSVRITGTGAARERHFDYTVDLAALGIGPGTDLIAQLEVRDNHAPTPQQALSTSLILRVASEQVAQGEALEGMVRKVLPAYFRSQRQIIIDAEALITQQRRLDVDTFVKRSDAIGVDQRILRLRYGQFLGEEAEGAPKPPPRTDAGPFGDMPTADAPTADTHDDHDDHDDHGDHGDHGDHDERHAQQQALAGGHDHGDHGHGDDGHGHGHGEGGTPVVFGSDTDVLSEYGHTHDHAEAATLLDPQTRATLKAALDQMWRSEGELRQGRPKDALPFAYKALEFIKQVQQAERIYLARVGPELPPIDEGRRLGGDRGTLSRPTTGPPFTSETDPRALQAWQALGRGGESAIDLDALRQWLQQHEAQLADPLSLAAAIETLRVEPSCGECRQRLREQLWPALMQPVTQPLRRPALDAMGQRYLDALETTSGERAPRESMSLERTP